MQTTELAAFQSEARTEEIRTAVSKRLSSRKYEHSLNVAKNAWLLAEKTDVDPKKMYVAGLLHDIANELSNEEILRLCDRTDGYIPSNEMKNAKSLHGIAGACIAYEEFGIRDGEILSAIAFHSGKVDMQPSEKILFLADMIDHSCIMGYDPARIWQQKNLDSAILAASADLIDYCAQNNLPIGERTRDSFDFIIENLHSNAGSDSLPNPVNLPAVDELTNASAKYLLEHIKSSRSEEEAAWYAAELMRYFSDPDS